LDRNGGSSPIRVVPVDAFGSEGRKTRTNRVDDFHLSSVLSFHFLFFYAGDFAPSIVGIVSVAHQSSIGSTNYNCIPFSRNRLGAHCNDKNECSCSLCGGARLAVV